jgi:serine O-acetyltransferase
LGNKSLFSTDLDKHYSIILGGRRHFVGKLKVWLFNYGLHCVGCYRLGQAALALFRRNKLLGLFPLAFYKILNRRIMAKYLVTISHEASIGRGLFFTHYFGILIGPVTMGENCVISHNVTIGQRVASGDHGVPRIGNNVWIGPGSVISGAIVIGNNVTISAGCVISKSLPDDCLVAGNPGRIIMNNYDNSAMINYRIQ